MKGIKDKGYQGFLFFCYSFITVYEKVCKDAALGFDVFLGYFGIDFPHGVDVRPASGEHGYLFGDLEVIAEGGEGAAEAVGADGGEAGFFAEAVGGAADGVRGAGGGVFRLLFCGFHGVTELGDQEGDGAAGGGVFVLLAMDERSVAVVYGGAVDMDAVVLKVYILPADGQDFRAAEGGQAEKDRNLVGVTFDGCQKKRNLLRGEIGQIIVDNLGQSNGEAEARGVVEDSADEAPGVFQRFGGDGLCLRVYGALKLLLGDGGELQTHKRLKSVALDLTVDTDGGGGENIFPGGDIIIDGIIQGFVAGAG